MRSLQHPSSGDLNLRHPRAPRGLSLSMLPLVTQTATQPSPHWGLYLFLG